MNPGPRSAGSRRLAGVGTTLALVIVLLTGVPAAGPSVAGRPAAAQGPSSTAHAPVPAAWTDLWLVPEPSQKPAREALTLATGVRQADAGDLRGAVATLNDAALRASALAGYAHYAAGRALLGLQRQDEARTRFEAALAATGDSGLRDLALLALAQQAERAGDWSRALGLYRRIADGRGTPPDAALAAVLRAATAAGDVAAAEGAALDLYFDYPASPHARTAAPAVERLREAASPERLSQLRTRDLLRADRLFEAREFADARSAFVSALPAATGETRDRLAVRLAVCDYQLKRHRAAADALLPLLDRPPYAAEARYYHLLAERALGRSEAYVARVWELVEAHADSPWAADALNNLASYYIVRDEADRALEVFARLVAGHSTSRHAERAAWKLGWAHYRQDNYVEAASVFDRAAAASPRSDYRPAWLYWGGRAHEQAGAADSAAARYRVAIADYQNSYYGRLAARALDQRGSATAVAMTAVPPAAPAAAPRPVPTASLIRALLNVDLFEFARAEVQFAQRTWGPSAPLEATLAWIHSRNGDLRLGISAMRRAYPQFLTAGGERLPAEMQRVIFPLDYWNLIRRYAAKHELDPYLMAALVAQESSFQADARSSANAWGLMQILPSTGRKLARAEGMRRFSTAKLVDPETNVRLGTRYFAGLVNSLGADHLALASYNAGPSRVTRWRAEKPGVPRDEFIDDIPFPETQNYVKRILGTAEDYRRLYPEGRAAHGSAERAVRPAANRQPAKSRTANPGKTGTATTTHAGRPAASRRPRAR